MEQVVVMKTEISNLVHMTRFLNNLHQVLSYSTDQKATMGIKLDIYVFITVSGSIPLLVDFWSLRVSTGQQSVLLDIFIVAVAILCNYYESLGYPPFFTILFTPIGFLAPEDYFLIIQLSNVLNLSVPDDSYSRNMSCAII